MNHRNHIAIFVFGAIAIVASTLAIGLTLSMPRTEAAPCRLPEVHEQLHIVIVRRYHSFAAECMYVTPRGMANRKKGAR